MELMVTTAPHIETPAQGMDMLQNYLMDNGSTLTEEVRDKLKSFVKRGESNVVSSVNAAEYIYAKRDELPNELLEIGAQLALMCQDYNFHNMAVDDRGAAMSATIREMKGVKSKAPDPSKLTAPEPKPELLATPEPQPAAPAGTSTTGDA